MAGSESAAAPSKAKPVTGYSQRVGEATRWAVTALAAAGAFAVGKLSFDRFGKGDYDQERILLGYGAISLFTVGVALLIMTAMWVSRANRITVAYLLSTRAFPKKIRTKLEKTKYLINGEKTLGDFVDSLNNEVAERAKAPHAYESDPAKKANLQVLLSARKALLTTARAERVARVNAVAAILLVAGSLAAATGAATFGYVTNQAIQESQDVPAGNLVPPASQQVMLRVPDDIDDREELTAAVGESCELSALAAIALNVGAPPEGTDPTRVVQVASSTTGSCLSAILWVSPDWLTVPSETPGDKVSKGERNAESDAPETSTG